MTKPDVDHQISRGAVIQPGDSELADRIFALLRDVGEALDLRLPDGRVIPVIFAQLDVSGRAYPSEYSVTLSDSFIRRLSEEQSGMIAADILFTATTVFIHECAHRLVSLLTYWGSWAERSHGFVFGVVNLSILIRAVSLRHDHPFSCFSSFGQYASAHTSFVPLEALSQYHASRVYNWSDVLDPMTGTNDRHPAACVQAWDHYALWLHIGIRLAARLAVSDLPPLKIAEEAAATGERYLPDFSIRPAWARRLPWAIVSAGYRHSRRVQRAADRFFRAVEAGRRGL